MTQFLYLIVTFTLISAQGVEFRLPTTVRPIFYTLKISPNENLDHFFGEVTIDVEVDSIIDSIHLHNSNLKINSLSLDQKLADYELLPEYELMRIFTDGTIINPGNHKIYMEFEGEISDYTYTDYRRGSQVGFFKTVHTGDGVVSFLALTKTEPTYTRRVFPCFDEPQLKSKFKITLITPDTKWVALSNMREIANFETPKGHVHIFETSMVMSTYLVEIAISQFTYKEHEFVSGDDKVLRVRGYTPRANTSDYLDSLKFIEYCLKFYGNYTEFDYGIQKLDLIEYDRISGRGTENWGLVILTSRSLFVDYHQTYSTFSHLFAHEIAHFWFGNLVTNRWWDDLWLQEGFASFFADKIRRKFTNESQSRTMTLDMVLNGDSSDFTWPIVRHVENPSSIQRQFNSMVYTKSWILLSTIESILGEENFRKAVVTFIGRFPYKVATTNDFIQTVQNLAPTIDLTTFIQSYLYQKHYPIVYVDEDENYYVLTQKPCIHPQENNPLGYKWTVPINYVSNLGEGTVWLHRDMEKLNLPKDNTTWIKFNRNFAGFYKTVYSPSLWDKIIANIQEIEPQERELLIFESNRRYSSCPKVLELIEKLSLLNGEFTPMSVNYLETLKNRLDYSHDSLIMRILTGYLQKFDVDNESFSNRTQRDVNNVDEDEIDGIKACSEWIKNNLSKYLSDWFTHI